METTNLNSYVALPFEPLSQEWLKELDLSKDGDFKSLFKREFDLPSTDLDNQLTCGIDETFSPMMKIPIEEEHGLPQSQSHVLGCENREFDVCALPHVVEMNTRFFSKEEIVRFGEVFGCEVLESSLNRAVLLHIRNRLIVLLSMEENEETVMKTVSDYYGKYGIVLIVSAYLPKFVGPSKMRWRCVTSVHQIASAVFPFLLL
jgi:hypothetical protein